VCSSDLGAFEDPRAELVVGDALTWIGQTDERWDVIISDLSDPIEEGPSFRLFTREYFSQLRGLLVERGILVVQAGPVSPAEVKLHARLANTLGVVFAHAHSYAAPWGFLLAAGRSLEPRVDPAAVDAAIAEKVEGELRLIDGAGLLGLLQTPLYVRHAIASEDRVYTLKEPPKFFGTGHSG